MKKIFLTFLLLAASPAMALTITPSTMSSGDWNNAVGAGHNPDVILSDDNCLGLGETNCYFLTFNLNDGIQWTGATSYAGGNSLNTDIPNFGYGGISENTRIAFVQIETGISDCNGLNYDDCVATGAVVSSGFLDISWVSGGKSRINTAVPIVENIISPYSIKVDTAIIPEDGIFTKIGGIINKVVSGSDPENNGTEEIFTSSKTPVVYSVKTAVGKNLIASSTGKRLIDGDLTAENPVFNGKDSILGIFYRINEYIANIMFKIKNLFLDAVL